MPPNPDLEAEMLSRLMMRFGAPEAARRPLQASPAAMAARARARTAGEERRRHLEARRRRSVRPRMAARRPGARPHRLHRRRPRPLEGHLFRPLRRSRRRHGAKDSDKGFSTKLMFWKTDEKDKPEQYRIMVAEGDPRSVVSVQDPSGAPDKQRNQREDPRAAQGPAQVDGALGSRDALRLHRQRQRRQRPRRRSRRHARPDRLRLRRPRHGRARSRRLGSRPSRSPRSSSRTSTPTMSGGVAGVRGALRHSGVGDVRHARTWSASASRASTHVYGFDSHDAFAIGDARNRSRFPVPHDAREPVQFVVGDGARRLGVLTDIGMSTPYVEASLSGCDALVLECNHDLEHAREQRLSVLAQAAHRRAPRPPAQRSGAPTLLARARHARGCSTSSPRICRSRTTRRTRRAPRLRGARLRGRLDRHRRPGRRLRLARDSLYDGDEHAWKSGRSSTAARPRPSTRRTTRTGSSCTIATTCRRSTASSSRKLDAKGRDQQQDQRVRDGQARRRRRADAFRARC